MLVEIVMSCDSKMTFDILDDRVDWFIAKINDNTDFLCFRVGNQRFDTHKNRWVRTDAS